MGEGDRLYIFSLDTSVRALRYCSLVLKMNAPNF